jgi:prophage regulatory protein
LGDVLKPLSLRIDSVRFPSGIVDFCVASCLNFLNHNSHKRCDRTEGETVSDSFLRLADVQRRAPFSRSTIYLMISRGEFPKQISLGARAVGWLKSEIDQWVESRITKAQ